MNINFSKIGLTLTDETLCVRLGYADNLIAQAVVKSVLGSLGKTNLLANIKFLSTKKEFRVLCWDSYIASSLIKIINNMVEQAQKRINKPVVYETSA